MEHFDIIENSEDVIRLLNDNQAVTLLKTDVLFHKLKELFTKIGDDDLNTVSVAFNLKKKEIYLQHKIKA